MIDIVVPFYNDKDDKWRSIFKKYLIEERPNDRQAMGEERYRDWDCFKYWFRCVEKNCSWVNKVFLILACESQVPEWLDTSNPKLRIVYHDEFIPKELLPTFNAMTIEMFIGNIKDLSDNYIYCNDDYYFLNPVSPNLFFVDGIPVYKHSEQKLVKFDGEYLTGSDATFYKALNNGMDFQLKISKDKAKWYAIDHLPVSHKKDFEKQIIDKYYTDLINANKISRFRNKNNISNHVYVCLYKDLNPYYHFDNYRNSYYVTLKSYVDFDSFTNCEMVCFNDTEQLDDYEVTKNKMVTFFENKFSNKSSFEK